MCKFKVPKIRRYYSLYCQPANYNSNLLQLYRQLNSHLTYKSYLNVLYFTARFFLFLLTLS